MEKNNFKISEDDLKSYVASFSHVKNFCEGKQLYNSQTRQPIGVGIEYLMACMLYCWTYLKDINKIDQNDVAYYEKRKKAAVDISFLGRWIQFVKDWLHNKFYSSKLDLNPKEVIKRRQLSNLKSECQKSIMPNINSIKLDNRQIVEQI